MLLTTGDVAKVLRVNPTTVKRWIKRGTLQAIELPHKEGGRVEHRIKSETLDNLLGETTHA